MFEGTLQPENVVGVMVVHVMPVTTVMPPWVLCRQCRNLVNGGHGRNRDLLWVTYNGEQ